MKLSPILFISKFENDWSRFVDFWENSELIEMDISVKLYKILKIFNVSSEIEIAINIVNNQLKSRFNNKKGFK